MRARKLTDTFIASLKPAPEGQRTSVADTVVPGLKVRVTDRGAKSYVLWRRYNGSKNNAARSLGRVGTITLAEARDKAREWLKLIREGEDPRAVERREREAKQLSNAITFGAVFEEYLADHVKPLRKAAYIEREMRNDLLSRWKNKPVAEISRRDVKEMIVAVKKRGPYQAHNVLGHARTFFNWAIDQEDYGIETSPCDHIKPASIIGKKKPRQRWLADSEIKAFWFATGKQGYPFGTLFRLLLMTGQRLSEIAESSWPEYNLACPRFRRHRVKVFNGAGGRPWRGVGSSHVSSSLRQFG